MLCPASSQGLGPPGPVPRQHIPSPFPHTHQGGWTRAHRLLIRCLTGDAHSQVFSEAHVYSLSPTGNHPLRGLQPQPRAFPQPLQTSPQPNYHSPSPPGRASLLAVRVRRAEVAAASRRLNLAGAGGGGGAGDWALARGYQGSRHACLRARSLIPSHLSLGALVPLSLVQIGKLKLRDGGGTPKVFSRGRAWLRTTPSP